MAAHARAFPRRGRNRDDRGRGAARRRRDKAGTAAVAVLFLVPTMALVLLGATAIGWSVRSVERQRHGSYDPTAHDVRGSRGQPASSDGRHSNRVSAALGALPCPTASGTLAELWLETRRAGLTVLGTSLLFAAAIPPSSPSATPKGGGHRSFSHSAAC